MLCFGIIVIGKVMWKKKCKSKCKYFTIFRLQAIFLHKKSHCSESQMAECFLSKWGLPLSLCLKACIKTEGWEVAVIFSSCYFLSTVTALYKGIESEH